ncbi:pyridoxal phosphate-dependent aminotransferase [Streptomyces sp. SID3343]|uniref:pyridoxal phosphate-dependent aminotransferase n=1 Tax=Streptomyces sp. SID3343 TaxID=2690260 RepID=UPI00136BBFA7|nr:pyridoxal phosphate-dependent aminotransferase [Streptomyces sp. SID3343]MYW04288.1 aminotransferase class I/II-fold pyridoxal phosphate-dependent enzyme [Streptomyces sp. SID3343]
MKLERLPALELADRARTATPGRVAAVAFRGVPMLPMPEHVVEAARAAAGEVFPRRSRGSAELRRAIASRLEAVHGVVVDPENELLITHGAQHGMSVALRALLSPGDEVLVPAPSYFFDGMIRMAGARPVYVPSDEDAGWDHVPEAVAAAVTPATRALLICNPNNPTGWVPSHETLGRLLDIAARSGLTVFSDECYERYVWDGPGYVPQMLLRDHHRDLVTVTSLSKNFAFTGWRVGYVNAPAHLLEPIHRAFEWDAINVGDVAQAAAHAVMTGPQHWIEREFATMRARRDILRDGLRSAGLESVRPDAGVFVFVDCTPLGVRGRRLEQLLLDHGLSALAGDAFAGPDTHVRMLYGGSAADLEEVGRRLAALTARRADIPGNRGSRRHC